MVTMLHCYHEISCSLSFTSLGHHLIGSLCVAAAYPLELIRRKIQVQGLGGRPVKYANFMDCTKQVYMNEGGMGAFYKGLGPNILKTLPSVAITFGAYETLMNYVFHATKS